MQAGEDPLNRTSCGIFVSACLSLSTIANAAEIKVISAGAVRSVVAAMIEDHKKQTGDTFEFTVGPTGVLRDIIATGKPADLLITSEPLMVEIEKTGKLVPGSRVDLGRVGIGVVIRDGAKAPDFSTPDAFRKMLLDVRSVGHTAPELGGTSSVHLLALLKTLGIHDVVAKKAVHRKGGIDVSRSVANGEAEIGITLISEIVPVKGARLAGPLPEAYQLWTVYTSAIPANSREPKAVRAFVDALVSPALAARWRAGGFEPPK
jgi:molybdate transport system substrate-binding protein